MSASDLACPPGTAVSVLPARSRVVPALLALVDAAIAVTAGAALLFLLFGRVETPLFSVSGFAKPFLQAFVLGSLRAGIRRPSWLPTMLGWVAHGARDLHRDLVTRWAWGQAVSDAVLVMLFTRLTAKAIGFAAYIVYPAFTPRSMTPPFAAARFAETFTAWDSAWYLDIAQRGYVFRPDGQSNIAFFPLYPMLIRGLAEAFGGSPRAYWISGIVISYACFLAALVLLHRLTEHVVGHREAARRAVLYLAVFPFSFPFTRVYAESLFLLVSVAAVWSAVRGRWSWAGLCGALAALARPNGILILIPLGLLALRDLPQLRTVAWRAAALLIVPAGLGAYCLFAFIVSGDPLAWLHAQAHWGYSIGNAPWALVQATLESIESRGLYGYLVSSQDSPFALTHALVGLAVLAITPSIFTRLGPAYGGYVAVGILIPFTGNALEGIGRYAATMFPIFIYLGATVRSRRAHEALLVVASLWLAMNIGFFVTQRPVY